jgi:hypothetical protein
VGELALPFLHLYHHVKLPYHHYEKVVNYLSVTHALLAKARLNGVNLILPVDLFVGEDPVSAVDKQKAFVNVAMDSRSDGVDYEGEVKTVPLTNTAAEAVIEGYFYDIGPETAKHISTAAGEADLVVIWGTVGACEIGSFQNGQQQLIQAVTNKPAADAAASSPERQRYTLIWGDATVEWFARFLDSDGEFEGDLVSGGFVAFQNRDSSMLRSLLGNKPSHVLSNGISYRPATAEEWRYSKKRVEVEEEEEEDEDDDEEEED